MFVTRPIRMPAAQCRLFVLIAAGLICSLEAAADPIWDFSATLGNGGTVTGTFTSNPGVTAISSFSFDLTNAGLPNTLSPGNYILNNSDAYVTAVFAPGDFQIEQSAPTNFDTILNLDFNSVPGSLGFSSLLQYPNFTGANANFLGIFSSGSAVAAPVTTPEPATLILIGSGLLAILFVEQLRRIRRTDGGS